LPVFAAANHGMIITRKKQIPKHWAFYAQLPLILTIYGTMVMNAPFLLLIKRFIDNPAAIMALFSIEVYVTILGGPFVSWLSDRIWTRFGRRKFFQATADLLRGVLLLAMPFAPNLWTLIVLKWLVGAFGDLGAPTQALAYEIVPSKQRGLSSGFKTAFMQLGNLVFFFLVLGRFDDVYFMGPFAMFSTEVSGASLMFFMGALLLLGIAFFEFFSIKEIYPPGRKRLHDGRKKGEPLAKHFVRSFAGDVFAKDLAPLYLLLFASLMFSFGLGAFEPLKYTEQWGYSLQDMGNVIAVGVIVGIAIGLLAGWLADKAGKMIVFFWATFGNLVINIAYTIYVYFKPDFRPELWEIVLFGNIAFIFGATKSVVSFPLLMEYVSRNRMGAAGAGITLFNGIFRNGISLLVGGWLFVWSLWFFPAAGFNVEAFFDRQLDEQQVRQRLADAGVGSEEQLLLRPLHQYGVDGETSSRWWIHRNSEEADRLLDEKKNLNNKIASLSTKADSPLIDGAEREALESEIEAKQKRIEAIEASLTAEAEALAQEVTPAFSEQRFAPGNQIESASFDGNVLSLVVETIEPLGKFKGKSHAEIVAATLEGPEHSLVENESPDALFRFRPAIEVHSPDDEEGRHRVAVAMTLDERFLVFYEAAVEAGVPSADAFDIAALLTSTVRSVLGREPGAFAIATARMSADGAGHAELDFMIEADVSGEEETLQAALSEAGFVSSAVLSEVAGGVSVRLTLDLEEVEGQEGLAEEAEETERLMALGLEEPVALGLARIEYVKLREALAAQPVYVTIPRHEVRPAFSEREYEYFFSSQILQIVTDIFGIFVLILILILEKRGRLVRYGALEDSNR